MDEDKVIDQTVRVEAFRRAWPFVRDFRWQLLLYLGLIATGAVISVLPPLIFKRMIDSAIPRADLGALSLLGMTLVAIFAAATLILVVTRYLGMKVGSGVVVNLRMALYDHVQRMPMGFFARTQTGKLQSRLNNDVMQANGLFTDTLSAVLSNVMTVTFTLVAMLLLSWQLTLLVMLMVPIFVVASELVGRRTRTLSKIQMRQWGELSTVMAERLNVAGALLVKLFGRMPDELERFGRRSRDVRDTGIRLGMVTTGFLALLTLLGSLASVAVYWMGGREIVHHTLTIGTMVALANYVQRVYAPIVDLASTRISLVSGLVSIERVFEVLDTPHAVADRPHASALIDTPGEVVFAGVWFRYPAVSGMSIRSLEPDGGSPLARQASQWILRDVSFTARAGSMTALVGGTGAGKSTLCSLLPRLYDVTCGSVKIDGHDVRDLTLASLAQSIGVVPQDIHLFHETIGDNLRYARPDATDEELAEACRRARIHDVIDGLPDRYETMVGERGYRFSGGEKQRLAIARVILKDPAIVILDEATAHLDSETELLVQEALATALEGRTSFVVAHRLSTVRSADQILVLADGQITESGTHDDLFGGGGLYRLLHDTQYSLGVTSGSRLEGEA